jgi:hypothetical protein
MGAMFQPNIIRNPTTKHSGSEQKIEDGIIRSSFNAFQMKAEQNLVKEGGKKQSNRPDLKKAGGKESKTKVRSGMVPFQGAVSHPY